MLTCPECQNEKTALPYKQDEGGDDERNICADCAVAFFVRDAAVHAVKYRREGERLLVRAKEYENHVTAITSSVSVIGTEAYIDQWLKSCER